MEKKLIDDNVLASRIRNDNLEAFALLYNRYSKKIYSFSLKYLRNRPEAEDLVQNVFKNLWEHRKSLDKNQSVKSYIYKSVVNHIYNIFKKRALRTRYLGYEMSRRDHFSNPTYDLVFTHDLENTINNVVANLPPQQHKIFSMSRGENYSHEEIAKKLDLSVRTVENQIYRTLKVIRKHLDIKS